MSSLKRKRQHYNTGPDKSKQNPLAHWASKKFFTCPAQIPTCPEFAQLKFLYAKDLQTEIEVPLLTLR